MRPRCVRGSSCCAHARGGIHHLISYHADDSIRLRYPTRVTRRNVTNEKRPTDSGLRRADERETRRPGVHQLDDALTAGTRGPTAPDPVDSRGLERQPLAGDVGAQCGGGSLVHCSACSPIARARPSSRFGVVVMERDGPGLGVARDASNLIDDRVAPAALGRPCRAAGTAAS